METFDSDGLARANKDEHAPKSPCVRNCCLTPEDICLGCFRSLDEILQWSQTDTQGKLNIISNAKTREHATKK